MSFAQIPEIYSTLGTLEPEVSNIKLITGTIATNQVAIATVVVACDDKNTQSNFITQRLLGYTPISLPRVKNRRKQATTYQKFFFDREMNSDNLFTSVFHQADTNLYQTEDELGKQ